MTKNNKWLLRWEQSSIDAIGGTKELKKKFDSKDEMEEFIKKMKRNVGSIHGGTRGRSSPSFRVIEKKKLDKIV